MQQVIINDKVLRFQEVRLIDSEGKQVGIVSSKEALQQAQDEGMDLILVASQANPPVCKIGDFSHYRYEIAKKEKDSRKAGRNKSGLVKELKLSLKIGDHDYQVRRKAAEKFLNKGYKVKVNVQFKGREITHPEVGEALMKRFCDDLAQLADIDDTKPSPKRNNMIVLLSPKKGVPAKKQSKPVPQKEVVEKNA